MQRIFGYMGVFILPFLLGEVQSCDRPAPPDPRQVAVHYDYNQLTEGANKGTNKAEVARWTAVSQGYFYGGFNNNVREIFTLHDNLTGRDFMAVTGCGVTEMHDERVGKRTIQQEE